MAFGVGSGASSGTVRIHHSDRGSQYASEGFRLLLEQEQMLQSMSRNSRVPLGRTKITLWPSHSGQQSKPSASITSAMASPKQAPMHGVLCSTASNPSTTQSAYIRLSDTNLPFSLNKAGHSKTSHRYTPAIKGKVIAGVITGFCLTGGDVADVAAAPQLLEGVEILVLGDRNYASPALQEQLKSEGASSTLLTAAKSRKRETDRCGTRLIARVRYRIETVFGQWCERLGLRKVKVKDTWHLASRLLRAALCHPICLHLTLGHDIKPLQFEKLLD